MESELVFLHFGSVADAELAMGAIRGLEAEGFLELAEAALVSRDPEGWVTVKPDEHGQQTRGAALGGVLGLVAGGLLGLPIIGILAGAGVGAKKSLDTDHLDQLIDDVSERLAPGTAVLALTVAALNDPETVTDRLAVHRDSLLRAEIPPSLQAALDQGRGGS